jgi:hypothetical protein
VANREEPRQRGRPLPAAPTRARALRLRGFRPAFPRMTLVSSSCPEAESRRRDEALWAARVLPEPREPAEGRHRAVSPGQPSRVAQADGTPPQAGRARVHYLAAAALATTGAGCRRHGGLDRPLTWEACGMRGQPAGAALRWRPMPAAARSRPSRRCPSMPRRRRRWATSARQQGRAPQPTPLDWNAGAVSAPSG